jgi:hypothetical protein
LITALRQFGFSSLNLTAQHFQLPGSIVQLGFPPNRIDLLTGIFGVSFETAWAGRIRGEPDGVEVTFIGCDALLVNKSSTGRTKDLADAEELRKRNP